jgi:hypothetical protein
MEVSPVHLNKLLTTKPSMNNQVAPTQAIVNKPDKDKEETSEQERRHKGNRRRNKKKDIVIERRTSSDRRGHEVEIEV